MAILVIIIPTFLKWLLHAKHIHVRVCLPSDGVYLINMTKKAVPKGWLKKLLVLDQQANSAHHYHILGY